MPTLASELVVPAFGYGIGTSVGYSESVSLIRRKI